MEVGGLRPKGYLFERVGISLFEVFKTVEKFVICVWEGAQKG